MAFGNADNVCYETYIHTEASTSHRSHTFSHNHRYTDRYIFDYYANDSFKLKVVYIKRCRISSEFI